MRLGVFGHFSVTDKDWVKYNLDMLYGVRGVRPSVVIVGPRKGPEEIAIEWARGEGLPVVSVTNSYNAVENCDEIVVFGERPQIVAWAYEEGVAVKTISQQGR
jgi:hypothetical protein